MRIAQRTTQALTGSTTNNMSGKQSLPKECQRGHKRTESNIDAAHRRALKTLVESQ